MDPEGGHDWARILSDISSNRRIGRPDFSIVVPCFEEEHGVEAFHQRLAAALDTLPHVIEVIYVNDGSRDGTLERLQGLFDSDTRISKLIDLANNCGQNHAQSAGIEHASGEDIILMDCDLQVDPMELSRLIDAFDADCDLVSGQRVKRQDSVVRRFLSDSGNLMINKLTGLSIRDLGSGLKIIRGSLIRAFDINPYRPLDPGAVILCLRRVVEVPVSHQARSHGRSRWTPRRALILYHNVLLNLVPVFYPILAVGLGILLLVALGVLTVAALLPGVFSWAINPLVPSVLIVLHMLLTVGMLLVLGEFTLRSRATANRPGYIIRRIMTRPLESEQGSESTPMELAITSADSPKGMY